MTRSLQHHGRFIPSEEIDAQMVRQWHFADVDRPQSLGGAGVMSAIPSLPMLGDLLPPPKVQSAPPAQVDAVEEGANADSASHLREEEVQALIEEARAEAREAGYQQGLEEGRSKGEQEGVEKTASEWLQKMDSYQAGEGRQVAERLQSILQIAQREVQGLQQQMAPDVLQLACDIARQVVRQELRSNPQALMPVVREAMDMLSAESKPVAARLNPEDWEQLKDALKAEFPQPKIEWLADPAILPGDCKLESAGAQVDGSLEKRWQRAVAALGLVSTWYDGAASHGK